MSPIKIIFCLHICLPLVGLSQNIPSSFGTVSGNFCLGNQVFQVNSQLNQNISLNKHNRVFFTVGVRGSYTENLNTVSITSDPAISVSYDDVRKKMATANIMLGVNIALSNSVYVELNSELLGISFGNTSNGKFYRGSMSYPFSGDLNGTNFLFSGGNIQHQLAIAFKVKRYLFVRVGLLSQSMVYDYTSRLSGYESFTLVNHNVMGFCGIEYQLCRYSGQK